MVYRPAHDRDLLQKLLPLAPILQQVPEEHLRHIIDEFGFLIARKNEVIVLQTDTTTELFIILTGKVKVSLLSEDGDEFILTDVKAGDFFGEISFIDGDPRSATVVAEEDSTFAVLTRDMLLDLIKEEPMIAINLLTSLTRRLRKSTERECRLAFLDVKERLLNLLHQLALLEGQAEEGGYIAIAKRTHRELGSRICASREAVTKVLKGLSAEEIVQEKGASLLLSPAVMQRQE